MYAIQQQSPKMELLNDPVSTFSMIISIIAFNAHHARQNQWIYAKIFSY